MSMLKFLVAFALVAGLAAPAALADGTTPRTAPEKRPAPTLKRSPTDETRTIPRAHPGETRISKMFTAPRARGVTRSGTESLTYSYLPTAPSLLEPSSGPASTTDFDGAPCPTRSNTSLSELFACTWR
jgi:hypothetical protein